MGWMGGGGMATTAPPQSDPAAPDVVTPVKPRTSMWQSPEALRARYGMATGMMKEGSSNAPVQHWTQGLARVVNGVVGAHNFNQTQADERAQKEEAGALWGGVAGARPGGMAATSPSAQPAPAQSQATTPPPAVEMYRPQYNPRWTGGQDGAPAIAGGGMAVSKPTPMPTQESVNAAPQVATTGGMGATLPQPSQPPQMPQAATVQAQTPPAPVPQQQGAAYPPSNITTPTRSRVSADAYDTMRQQQRASLAELAARGDQNAVAMLQKMTAEDAERVRPLTPQEEMDMRVKEAGLEKANLDIAQAKSQFARTGSDAYGNPVYGFVDPINHRVLPAQGAPQSQQTAAGLTGEEFLKTLPAPIAMQVKGIAEGRIPYPGAFALKQPYWQRVTEALSQYEPGADANLYRTRYATQKDMATGKMGQNIASFNTALGHMHDLYKQIDGLGNFDTMPILNGPINAVKGSVSGDAQAKLNTFNATKQKVIEETTKAFKGSGGTVHDLEMAEKELSSAASPAALKATVRKYLDLMKSRIEAVGDQYNRGMSVGQPRAAITLLSPHSQEIVRELEGGNGGGGHAGNYMVGSPQPAPAPSAAPIEGAKQAPDGHWYLPDPSRPGKFLQVQ